MNIESVISSALASEVDPVLRSHEFSRQNKSLVYRRQVSQGTQQIKMVFDSNPTYEVKAIAHVLPQVIVVLDNVNKLVSEMVGNELSLIGTTDFTVREQIQNAAPRDQRCISWYIYESEDPQTCMRSINQFLQTWTIPFLDEYMSAEALVRGYQSGDERLPNERNFFVFVAGAFLVLNQPTQALNVLESKFKRPGARKEYAKVFDYVASRISQN